MLLSASAVYRQAANLTPETSTIAKTDSHCVMCAAPLPAGTAANLVTKQTFDDAFNNKLDLRARAGRYVCGDCQVLWSKDWMQRYSKSFACAAGVFKLASNDHVASFLINPPEPPFVAIFSTRQQQHMIWRTPPSLSREFFIVRVDGDLLTIRHGALMEAHRAFKHAESVMATTALARTGKKLKPPAALFSRELAAGNMGMVRRDVTELLQQTGDHRTIDLLNQLTMGEWWGLGAIRHYALDAAPPHQNALVED